MYGINSHNEVGYRHLIGCVDGRHSLRTSISSETSFKSDVLFEDIVRSSWSLWGPQTTFVSPTYLGDRSWLSQWRTWNSYDLVYTREKTFIVKRKTLCWKPNDDPEHLWPVNWSHWHTGLEGSDSPTTNWVDPYANPRIPSFDSSLRHSIYWLEFVRDFHVYSTFLSIKSEKVVFGGKVPEKWGLGSDTDRSNTIYRPFGVWVRTKYLPKGTRWPWWDCPHRRRDIFMNPHLYFRSLLPFKRVVLLVAHVNYQVIKTSLSTCLRD